MARLPRVVMPGHPHLVIHRGHSGQTVMADAGDRSLYLASLHGAARDARVAIHAYGLLASEIRLLVMPQESSGLAALMQSVGRRYVPAFNRKYGRTGTPWEGRFRSTVIEAEHYFLPCLRFVEAWHEGGSEQAASATRQASWSSAAHHRGEQVDALITDHPAFWAFGNTPFEREVAYRRFLEQPPATGEVAAILRAALNGWVLGSAEFSERVAAKTGRRPQRAPRGRPRKGDGSIQPEH